MVCYNSVTNKKGGAYVAGKFLAKKEKKGKFLAYFLPVLLAVFAVLSVIAAVKIFQVRKERAVGKEVYTNLAQSIAVIDAPNGEEELPQQITIDVTTPSVHVDFDALQTINQEGVAWISSDDGAIHYPVMQGTDNDYYLDHMPDGTVNRNGSIFMDFRNEPDFSDRNTFIYGHNMLDGAMFASLSRYSEAGYYDKHPSLLLVAPSGSYSLEVFAGCVVPGNSDVYQLSFRDEADFGAYIEKVTAISEFQTPVEVSAADRLVTLSTCAYNYDDARYVLFCRLQPMQ